VVHTSAVALPDRSAIKNHNEPPTNFHPDQPLCLVDSVAQHWLRCTQILTPLSLFPAPQCGGLQLCLTKLWCMLPLALLTSVPGIPPTRQTFCGQPSRGLLHMAVKKLRTSVPALFRRRTVCALCKFIRRLNFPLPGSRYQHGGLGEFRCGGADLDRYASFWQAACNVSTTQASGCTRSILPVE
jgi:hypothetical protein